MKIKDSSFYIEALDYSPLMISEREIVNSLLLFRKNPRLAEVLTEHLRDLWWKYDPEKLLKNNKRIDLLQLMVEMIVLNCTGVDNLEFIEWSRIILSKDRGVNKKKIPLFEISDFFLIRGKKRSQSLVLKNMVIM